MLRRIPAFLLALLVAALMAACQAQPTPPPVTATETVVPSPTIEPSPTPVPPRTLTVCLAEEPQTLYPYGGSSRSMWNVLESVYDGPFDTRAFSTQPVILEKLPSLADGDAVLQAVGVQTGDPVVDSSGALASLTAGMTVFPSGCHAPECAITWDGSTALQMDHLTLTFKIKAGVQWSDGTPLTADELGLFI